MYRKKKSGETKRNEQKCKCKIILLTARGMGEREMLVRSLGFILARIKMDKAFLLIFYYFYYSPIYWVKHVRSAIEINNWYSEWSLLSAFGSCVTSLFGNNLFLFVSSYSEVASAFLASHTDIFLFLFLVNV